MKILRTIARDHGKTFLKYATVGVSGTMIDVGLFTLIVATTTLGDSIIGHLAAATVSFVAAVVNNYLLNRHWTFSDRRGAIRKEFSKFFIVSVGGLVLNTLCLSIFSALLIQMVGGSTVADLPTWGSALAKICASCVVLAYNFSANHLWTFKRASTASHV